MLTYAEILTEYLDRTKDDSTENSNRGKRRINQNYKMICAGYSYPWLERTFTTTSVAGQNNYQLPQYFRKPRTAKVTIDSDDYIMQEIINPETFDGITRDADDIESDFSNYFHIREGEILIYPTFSTSGQTITVLGLFKPEKFVNDTDYNTGTVSVTSGSATVTGSGTTFTSQTDNDNLNIIINDRSYRVATIDSATQLTLESNFNGTTGSGLSYTLADVPILPEEYQDLLWILPTLEYYSMDREDSKMYQMLEAKKNEIEGRLIASTKRKSTSNVVDRMKDRVKNINFYPESIG